MRRVFTPEFLDDAQGALNDGATLTEVARARGCSADNLSKALRARGFVYVAPHRPAHNAKQVDVREVADRFKQGESVLALARRFGVTRDGIVRRLARVGVDARGRGEAMRVRMAHTEPAERERLTQAAHDAVRGVPKSLEHREHIADTRARGLRVRIGYGEEMLADRLRALGRDVTRQAAFGPYNVDLLVDGRVAVEPHSSGSSPLRTRKGRERVEYLLHRGLSVLWVAFSDPEGLDLCAEHIIADVDELRRDPPAAREYRMVWCGVERFTRVRNERGQLAAVPAPVRAHYARRESERRVAG